MAPVSRDRSSTWWRFALSPRMALLLAWSMALASLWVQQGPLSWLVAGVALFGIPAMWLLLQMAWQSLLTRQPQTALLQLNHHQT